MEISKMITKRRKNLHLSQQQLAAKVKVTDTEVTRWESGKILPEAEVLPVLAETLNVSVDKLVGDTSKENILNGGKEKIDNSQIARYKIFVAISFALLLAAFPFTFISLLFMVIFTTGSIISMIVGTILYKTFYKDIFYTKIYKRLLAKCVVSYVLTLFCMLFLTSLFIFGRPYIGGIPGFAGCCLAAVGIATPIIFENKGYNLSHKNKLIFYITTGILWLLLILSSAQFLYALDFSYNQEDISLILLLIFLIIFFLNYFFYGFKTDIKD